MAATSATSATANQFSRGARSWERAEANEGQPRTSSVPNSASRTVITTGRSQRRLRREVGSARGAVASGVFTGRTVGLRQVGGNGIRPGTPGRLPASGQGHSVAGDSGAARRGDGVLRAGEGAGAEAELFQFIHD